MEVPPPPQRRSRICLGWSRDGGPRRFPCRSCFPLLLLPTFSFSINSSPPTPPLPRLQLQTQTHLCTSGHELPRDNPTGSFSPSGLGEFSPLFSGLGPSKPDSEPGKLRVRLYWGPPSSKHNFSSSRWRHPGKFGCQKRSHPALVVSPSLSQPPAHPLQTGSGHKSGGFRASRNFYWDNYPDK